MKLIKIIISFLAMAANDAAASEPTKGPLISLIVTEFLAVPETFQAIYVAGAIAGMTFVSYGYSLKDHDEVVACYQSRPLGEFAKEVRKHAATKKNFNQSIATLVAETAGKLCKD